MKHQKKGKEKKKPNQIKINRIKTTRTGWSAIENRTLLDIRNRESDSFFYLILKFWFSLSLSLSFYHYSRYQFNDTCFSLLGSSLGTLFICFFLFLSIFRVRRLLRHSKTSREVLLFFLNKK